MNKIILYCEPCRVITNLDRTEHRRVGARCEFCGSAGVEVYVWSYSTSRINRAMRDMADHVKQEKARMKTNDEIEREAIASIENGGER